MKALICYLRIYYLCFVSIFKLNLGDEVMHDGQKFIINNGVSSPAWDLLLDGRSYRIHESRFKKIISARNVMHDLTSTYRFYKGYWFGIWLKLEPWWTIPNWTIARWSMRNVKRGAM